MARLDPSPIRAGRVRQLVTIQQNVLAGQLDSRGEEQQSWEDFCRVWADVQPQFFGSTEAMAGAQLMPFQTYLVECYYVPGVVPKMRILMEDGGLLDIHAVMDPDSRRRKLILHCLQRLAQVPNA